MPRISIPALLGMDRGRPLGASLTDGGAYPRLLHNLRPDHGEISRRPGLSAIANPPTLPTVIGATKTSFDVLMIQEVDVQPRTTGRFLIVTEREGWLGTPGSWTKINPTHAVGTVQVTNGSPTVAGTTTTWFDRGIKPTDYFVGPDGATYEIAAVPNNTTLTLAANYQGANAGPGASYSIQRNFGFTYGARNAAVGVSGTAFMPFVASLQGDLYLCGMVSGGLQTGTNVADGGVLKITNGAAAFGAWTTSYVLSGQNEVEVGVDFLDQNLTPFGFGKLADGRLVIVHHMYSISTSASANRRVTYSSHLDTAVWTTSPGGSTDIEDFEGSITGAVFYTNSVSIHLTDGIEIGELTGQDDPPLRFSPSKSSVGAIGPRFLAKMTSGPALQGREVFLGSDGRPYTFNGLESSPITLGGIDLEFTEERAGEKGPQLRSDLAPGMLYLDPYRAEVAFLFFYVEGGTNEQKTREVRVSYETGLPWRAQYAGFVGCAYVPRLYGLTGLLWATSPSTTAVVLGTRTDSSWWWVGKEETTSDALAPASGDMDGVRLLLDGIDGGDPETAKVVKEILVFFRVPRQAAAGSFSPTLTWRTEYGSSQTATLVAAVNPSVEDTGTTYHRPEAAAVYVCDEKPWRSLSLELSSPDGNAWTKNLTRIVIDYEVAADVRAE